MYMYIYIYMYIHIYIYVYTFIYTCIATNRWGNQGPSCASSPWVIYIYIYICIHMYIHIHVYIHIYMYCQKQVGPSGPITRLLSMGDIYIFIYIWYICTCIHTYIYVLPKIGGAIRADHAPPLHEGYICIYT